VSKNENALTPEAFIKLIENAVDALVDLEGGVYPNGLTANMSGALRELRERERELELRLERNGRPA
jgi:hypothetical protein